MKSVLALMALVIGTMAPQAHAVYRFGWERPILSAQMKIQKAVGALDSVKDAELILTRKDESQSPTGMIVELDGRETTLTITRIESIGCGSRKLVAISRDAHVNGDFAKLELVDHTTRLCEDYRPYLWEAKLTTGSHFKHVEGGKLFMVGNPEGVVTPM